MNFVVFVIALLVLTGCYEAYNLIEPRRQRREVKRQEWEKDRARKEREFQASERLCEAICQSAKRNEWKHEHIVWRHPSGMELCDETWTSRCRYQPTVGSGGVTAFNYDAFNKDQVARIQAALTREDEDTDTKRTQNLDALTAQIEPIDLQVAQAAAELQEWMNDE